MDSIQILFYLLSLVIIGFTAFQIYVIKKNGKFNEESYEKVKALVYDAINEMTELHKQKQVSKEVFINGVIALIRHKIIENIGLSEADKKFWTEDKLQNLFNPIITVMMDKIDKQLENK